MAEVKYSPIEGLPGYRVGDDGSVWSSWRFKGKGYGGQSEWYISEIWKRLKPDVRKSDGRQRYAIRVEGGKHRKFQASHLVLNAFVGKAPDGYEACHNDGDCSNNSVTNLRWDTIEANKADMVRHGTDLSGERSGMAKLNWEKVREIRRSFAAGEFTKTELARKNNVTPTLIGYVIAEKIWKQK